MEKKASAGAGKERTRIPVEKRKRQSRPILSETKGERVYMAEPIDETCWAYMKLLREHDRTKKSTRWILMRRSISSGRICTGF